MNLMEELENNIKISEQRQIRGRFITQLDKLFENFADSYSISEILHTLLRKESDIENPYFWKDEKILKKSELLYRRIIKEMENERR